jgi:hypothetical protein
LILSSEEIPFFKTEYPIIYIIDSFLIYYRTIIIWRRVREFENRKFCLITLISRSRYSRLDSRIRFYYKIFFPYSFRLSPSSIGIADIYNFLRYKTKRINIISNYNIKPQLRWLTKNRENEVEIIDRSKSKNR